MTQLKIISAVIFSVMSIVSCSTSQTQLKEFVEQINIVSTEAWLNLMPGGPGSFHLTGEYESNDDFILRAKLTTIKVSSSNELIYEIQSDNISSEVQIGNDIKALRYRFNIKRGLKLNEKIQMTENLDVKLIFELNGDLFEKDVKNIVLTRAY